MNLFIIISALIAIAYGIFYSKKIISLPAGNDRMKDIALAIQTGAKAYLNRQ